MKHTEENEDYTLEYEIGEVAMMRVYGICLQYFKKLGHFHGDSIHQSDDTYETAPEFLTELAEEGFKFNKTYK